MITTDLVGERCAGCGAENSANARFCHNCGRQIAASPPDGAESTTSGGAPSHRQVMSWIALLIAALAFAAAAAALLKQRDQANALDEALATIEQQAVGSKQQAQRLADLEKEQLVISGQVEKQAEGTKQLAATVLPSVFTIETPYGGGSGFAAWIQGGDTIILTANHVVEGFDRVSVQRKGATWRGTVIETDTTNDLATVRVPGTIADALWQQPTTTFPKVGDTLVLFGSPLGYEGTVTKGIVSRITYREIQTDAPANPGNSGGPALKENGEVAGVVVSGYEGRDISFAIPMRRVCVKLRSC